MAARSHRTSVGEPRIGGTAHRRTTTRAGSPFESRSSSTYWPDFSVANATVTVNPDGTGFVGKGDVQTVLGLSNPLMQNTTVTLTKKSTTEQSFDWTCVKTVVSGNGTVRETRQERANVTTTDVTAVVSSVARVKNQITGYNLTGSGATRTTSVVDGPELLSCPDASSDFVLDQESVVEGRPTVTGGGFYVNGVYLPITPGRGSVHQLIQNSSIT
jgi:hypothetical protein